MKPTILEQAVDVSADFILTYGSKTEIFYFASPENTKSVFDLSKGEV